MKFLLLTLISLLLLSISQITFAQNGQSNLPPEVVKEMTEKSKKFNSEITELKLKQAESNYKKTQEFFKSQHEKKIEKIKKIAAIKDTFTVGQREKNRELKKQIKELHKQFKEESKKARQQFFKVTLKEQRTEFRKSTKEKRESFRKEMREKRGEYKKKYGGRSKGKGKGKGNRKGNRK